MRDIHGRYLDTKAITENGPSWAKGCGRCRFGILSAPDITGVAPMHLERLVQAIDKEIVFCECEAGKMYRLTLGRIRNSLIAEANRDNRKHMEWQEAKHDTHRDIEVTRLKMQEAREKTPVPSMHMDTAIELVTA
jgi:hypothetical protein